MKGTEMTFLNASHWSVGWFKSTTANINQVLLSDHLNDTWARTNLSKWLPFSPPPTGSWQTGFNRESDTFMLA